MNENCVERLPIQHATASVNFTVRTTMGACYYKMEKIGRCVGFNARMLSASAIRQKQSIDYKVWGCSSIYLLYNSLGPSGQRHTETRLKKRSLTNMSNHCLDQIFTHSLQKMTMSISTLSYLRTYSSSSKLVTCITRDQNLGKPERRLLELFQLELPRSSTCEKILLSTQWPYGLGVTLETTAFCDYLQDDFLCWSHHWLSSQVSQEEEGVGGRGGGGGRHIVAGWYLGWRVSSLLSTGHLYGHQTTVLVLRWRPLYPTNPQPRTGSNKAPLRTMAKPAMWLAFCDHKTRISVS